jgi:excisionase family DNA binding protein
MPKTKPVTEKRYSVADLNRMQATRTVAKRGYSVEEVAEMLSISKGFAWNEIRAGKLRATRLGRRVIILHENLDDYLARAEVITAA